MRYLIQRLPLPIGERAGVRGKSCGIPSSVRGDDHGFLPEVRLSQGSPLTPALSPVGRGSWAGVHTRFMALLVLLCCFSFALHAQSSAATQHEQVAATPQKMSADTLNDVLSQLSKHTAVRAAFEQQRLNPALTQPQNSSGQLLFVTGHGMLWQVQKPYQQTLALTGSKTLTIDADGRMQPVRNERGVGQISQMLQSMLSGQLDAVTRQFTVSAEGSATQWTLRFTPKQARVAQVLRDIQLDGGVFLQRIHIDMQDGTQTDIRMTDTRDAGPLSELEKHALGFP